MKIFLKALILTNFKGIRHTKIDFVQVTDIKGRNAIGKTTLMDAFLWLFFGKDSTDRKDFEIKTVDENNEPYHGLDHEVSALIDVDGQEISLRRVYKEKWVTKRGEKEPVFSGHETSFFWNDVPLKLEEYQAKIAGIMDEKLFKLLTNTSYFNSLKWQDRRNVLLAIAGSITDQDVAAGNPDFLELLKAIVGKKSMEEYGREISQKKKKIKDELALLPSRIDEANRSMPEEKDYVAIASQIQEASISVVNIDELLTNKTQGERDHQNQVSELIKKRGVITRQMTELQDQLKREIVDRGNERVCKIRDLQTEISRKQEDLTRSRNEYKYDEGRKTSLIQEQIDLREKWNKIDGEKLEFKTGEFHCPACKREFEAGDVQAKKDELTKNFNLSKSNRLNAVTERGKLVGEEISAIEVKLGNLKSTGEGLNAEIATLTERKNQLDTEHARMTADEAELIDQAIASSKEFQEFQKHLVSINEQIEQPYASDNNDLLNRKRELSSQLDNLKRDLSTKEIRVKQLDRINELREQESKMAQELADLEGTEFTIEQFTKAKMDTLESRINGRFTDVRFKMFEDQINGGQAEACTTLVKGVPYPDVNNAGKIQAGLEIINVLSDHYGIVAPVWVDNRESVIDLPCTKAQLINLIVSPDHDKLTVTASRQALAVA